MGSRTDSSVFSYKAVSKQNDSQITLNRNKSLNDNSKFKRKPKIGQLVEIWRERVCDQVRMRKLRIENESSF